MAGNLQPLNQQFSIVDAHGNPTDYFIRWAQQRQIDITEAITLLQLQEYLDAHMLQEGSGIQITPSGSLNDSPTIDADAQEILDQISATRGTILYRGLLGWAGLAPGAAGNFLQSAGAGADPAWAAGPAGGAWSVIGTQAMAGLIQKDFTGLGSYQDLLLFAEGLTNGTGTFQGVRVSVNNGATFPAAAGDYINLTTAGVSTAVTNFSGIDTSTTLARSSSFWLPGSNVNGAKKKCVTTAGIERWFVQSTSPINALRFFATAGTVWTAGSITLLGRS